MSNLPRELYKSGIIDGYPVSASCQCGRQFTCMIESVFWEEVTLHEDQNGHLVSVTYSNGETW